MSSTLLHHVYCQLRMSSVVSACPCHHCHCRACVSCAIEQVSISVVYICCCAFWPTIYIQQTGLIASTPSFCWFVVKSQVCVLTSAFRVECCHHDSCIWFTARPSANFYTAAISKGHWGCCWGWRGPHGKLHTWHRGSPHGLYGGPLYHRPWCCCGVGAGREHTHTPGDTLLIVQCFLTLCDLNLADGACKGCLLYTFIVPLCYTCMTRLWCLACACTYIMTAMTSALFVCFPISTGRLLCSLASRACQVSQAAFPGFGHIMFYHNRRTSR